MKKQKHIVFRGREDKLEEVALLFSTYLGGSVLDVGCDAKYLARSVTGRYIGVDISGTPDVCVDVETGLPFHAMSVDTVVAFDVMEHCNRIHDLFDELCRVSRSYVIVGLPNIYEWHFRLAFFLGKPISGKYGLPLNPPIDRHRWLFSLDEARHFVRQRAIKAGFCIVAEAFGYYGYIRLLPRLITSLGRLFSPFGTSVFAYQYWTVLCRETMQNK